jgi:hypothetical protein
MSYGIQHYIALLRGGSALKVSLRQRYYPLKEALLSFSRLPEKHSRTGDGGAMMEDTFHFMRLLASS